MYEQQQRRFQKRLHIKSGTDGMFHSVHVLSHRVDKLTILDAEVRQNRFLFEIQPAGRLVGVAE